jgi:hypothetical protein
MWSRWDFRGVSWKNVLVEGLSCRKLGSSSRKLRFLRPKKYGVSVVFDMCLSLGSVSFGADRFHDDFLCEQGYSI